MAQYRYFHGGADLMRAYFHRRKLKNGISKPSGPARGRPHRGPEGTLCTRLRPFRTRRRTEGPGARKKSDSFRGPAPCPRRSRTVPLGLLWSEIAPTEQARASAGFVLYVYPAAPRVGDGTLLVPCSIPLVQSPPKLGPP